MPSSGVLRPYLELVRIQLTPTAVADSFAGYCLTVAARKSAPSAGTAAALALASVFAYWMGMATNDLLDLEKDRRFAPGRPLCRGALRQGPAWILAGVLAAAAILAALAASTDAALGVCGVMAAALVYNAGGKRLPVLGNLLMGSCRAGNLILGALGAVPIQELAYNDDLRFEILQAAAILGLYIAGVTSVSILEDSPPRRGSLLVPTLPLLIVPLALVSLGWPPDRWPETLLQKAWAAGNALLLAALLVSAMVRAIRSAAAWQSGPSGPHPAEQFVRSGLSGLFLIDAGVLLSRHPRQVWGPVVAIYGLMILAWLWRRQWLQSPA